VSDCVAKAYDEFNNGLRQERYRFEQTAAAFQIDAIHLAMIDRLAETEKASIVMLATAPIPGAAGKSMEARNAAVMSRYTLLLSRIGEGLNEGAIDAANGTRLAWMIGGKVGNLTKAASMARIYGYLGVLGFNLSQARDGYGFASAFALLPVADSLAIQSALDFANTYMGILDSAPLNEMPGVPRIAQDATRSQLKKLVKSFRNTIDNCGKCAKNAKQ
jgi:hypothetical protein